MYWLIVLTFLSFKSYADLVMDQGYIAPFRYENYPLSSFVTDYSKVMDVNVSYSSGIIFKKAVINLKINKKMNKNEFKNLFFNTLDSQGYTALEDGNIIWLENTRDVRHLPLDVYSGVNYPKNSSYITYLHKLKYPISREVVNNLRPFVSKYARIIEPTDGRTIIFNEKGENISRLLDMVQLLDTDKVYQHVLNFTPTPDNDADNPLRSKVIELEIDKKILEEKYMNLKEEQKS